LKKQSTADLEKLYQEKITGLNQQIELVTKNYNDQQADAQKLQSERQRIYDERIATYKSQVQSLEKKSINWAAILIAVIVALLIGYL
jgi:DNA repair exonuclease SbcCD ATPase subunit